MFKPRDRTWYEKLFFISKLNLAEQCFRNLLSIQSPFNISQNTVEKIFTDYGIRKDGRLNIGKSMWGQTLIAFISDNLISDEELLYLNRLALLFDLPFDDLEKLKKDIVFPRYKRAVVEALSDRMITTDEANFLMALQEQLRLPKDEAMSFLNSYREKLAYEKINELIADKRFSPRKLEDLKKFADDIQINLGFTDELKAQLERYATYWRIENGELPVINSSIVVGYFSCL